MSYEHLCRTNPASDYHVAHRNIDNGVQTMTAPESYRGTNHSKEVANRTRLCHSLVAVCTAILVVTLCLPVCSHAQSEEEDIRRSAETMKKIEVLRTRGAFLARNGKYAAAISAMEEILPLLDLPDETLLYNLGTLSMDGMKDCNKAVLYYQGYLYAAPNDKGTPEVRKRLKRCLRTIRAGKLTLNSQPKSVEVRLNNVILGRTPLGEIQLGPGPYQLSVERVDYQKYASEIIIQPSLETRHNIRMTKVVYKGALTVKSQPEGARVWINDDLVGQAPITRKGLDTKKYLVRIEKDGWDRWIRYVEVLRDAVVTVDAKLENTGVNVPIPPLPRND